MQNKRRFVVFAIFVLCMFFLMTFAGGSNNDKVATRDVEFIDGFDNSTISLQKVEVGKDAEVPEDPEHENYVFAGWFLYEDHDIRVTDFEEIMEDLKVIALYAGDLNNNGIADEDDEYFTVTFMDSLTNTVIDEQEVLVGLDASAPQAPVHNGYTFTGWSDGYTNVQSDITVNALYRNNPVETYRVTFIDGDTNEVFDTQTIERGRAATLPEAPKHEGRVFDHWEGNYTNITADTTITAVYTDDKNNDGVADDTQPHYTVTYVDYDDTELEVFEDVLVDLETPTIADPEREYYTFEGWDPEVAATVTDNATYKATYAPINDEDKDGKADEEEDKFTVTYVVDEVEVAKYENLVDGIATPTIADPDKEYAVFGGWDPEVAETVTADATYTATWLADEDNDNIADEEEDKFTVTYVVDEVEVAKYENLVDGIATPTIADPDKEYAVFGGWDPEVAATVTADATYTATWLEDADNDNIADEDEDKFTVIYKDGEEELVKHENLVDGITTPEAPEVADKEYAVFGGWEPTIAETVTADATYTVVWLEDKDNDNIADEDENKYTVTYVVDEVEVAKYENLVDGIATPTIADPDKEYAVFGGWDPEVAETVTANVTYTATWLADENNNNIPDSEEDMFTIIYKDYDGTIIETFENQVVGKATPTIADPEREYYTFEGWDPEVAETVTATVEYTATYKPINDEDNDGKADEEENKYTVTYVVDEVEVAKYENLVDGIATPTIADPDKEYAVFGGWDPEVAATVTADATYTATWLADEDNDNIADEDEDKFTVKYVVDGETVAEYNDLVDGIATPTIADPDKEKAVFGGWDPEVAATVTKDETYTATWLADEDNDNIADEDEDKFTVKYVVDGETVAEYNDLVDGIATPTIADPDKEYAVFGGWNPEVAETVTADATYTATWLTDEDNDNIADEDEDKFTVTYVVDEVEVAKYENLVDGIATPTIADPDKEYAVFGGWDPEVAATVTKDETYTATWLADENNNDIPDSEEDMFTIIYKDYDGTVIETFENQVINKVTPTIADPEREYYEFTGWDPEVAETVTATVEYTATYRPYNDEDEDGKADEEENKYTVTYVVDEVEVAKYENLVDGIATPTIADPDKEYAVFGGWDPEVTATVTKDVTYTATWLEDKDNDNIADEDEDKFTVKYVVDGETVAEYNDLVDGIATPTIADPDKEYAVFGGWDPEVAETVTKDVTYTATWLEDKDNDNIADEDENKYTVTYVVDEVEVAKYENLVDGIATPTIADPDKEYAVFGGWNPEVAATVTKDVTYTATWLEDKDNDNIADEDENKYTVTYVVDEVEVAKYENLVDGIATPTIADPDKEYAVFGGWDPEVAATVTADATYTATWLADENNNNIPDSEEDMFTIIYKDYDGTAIETFENQVVGKATPTIADPEREYYTFEGWDPEVAETVTATVEYTATYKPINDEDKDGKADEEEDKFTVTYVVDEVEVAKYENLVDGIATPTIADPDKEYAVFGGWDPEVAETVTANVTYTATWLADEDNDNIPDEEEDKFTVTYVVDGENYKVYENQVDGIATPVPANPEKTYYDFTGWNPAVAATVTADATYTATFTPQNDTNGDGVADELQRRIIFNDWDGTELLNKLVTLGENTPEPTVPTRNYYTFAGWNPAVADKVVEDATYTATYKPVNDTNDDDVADEEQRRVIFQNWDGTELLNELVTIGEATPVPETNPTRNEYYTFAGWDPEVAATVTADATYTAKYTPGEDKNGDGIDDREQTLWEVRFFGFGGATAPIGDVQYVLDGEAAVAPEAPAVSGYAFQGWLQDFSNVTSNLEVYSSYIDIEAPYINPTVTLYNEKDGAYQNANITAIVTDNDAVKTVKYLLGEHSAEDYATATEMTAEADGTYQINGLTQNSVYTIFAEDMTGNVSVVHVEVEGITVLTGDFEDLYATGSFGSLSGFPLIGTYKKTLSITTKTGVVISDARVYYGYDDGNENEYQTADAFKNDPTLGTAIEHTDNALTYQLAGNFYEKVTIYVQYAEEVEIAPGVTETVYTEKVYTTRLSYLFGE